MHERTTVWLRRLALLVSTICAVPALAGQDVGEACGVVAGGKQCDKGLSCTVIGVCKRDSGGKRGEGCGPGFECESGLSCEAGTQKCVGKGKEGDPCHATRPCKSSLTCEAGTQRCVAPGEEGDSCHATRPCDDGLSCEAGSQTCVSPGSVGDACHATRPCKSNLSCAPGSQRCFHRPRTEEEPCSAGFECAKGLACQPFTQRCAVAKQVCSMCATNDDCNDGLSCVDGLCRGKVFDIKLVWADSPKGVKAPSKALKDSMDLATSRWRRVIREHLKNKNVTMPTDTSDLDVPEWMVPHVTGKSWNDLMVVARVAGPAQDDDFKVKSSVLAHAREVWVDSDGMPRLGMIEVNEARMESDTLKYVEETLMHEIGHVLGFSDQMFSRKNLLSPNRKFFVGPSAIAAYKELGGKGSIQLQWSKSEGFMPGSHWSEDSLTTEMMTPAHNREGLAEEASWSSSPLSRISIAALEDMGYSVAKCEGQVYSVPANAVSGSTYRPPAEKPNPLPGAPNFSVTAVLEVGSGPWGTDRDLALCPRGTWASGFSLRVEPKNKKGEDDTALNSVRLICTDPQATRSMRVQSHPGYWGDWGAVTSCPAGKFITGANLRLEEKQKKKDDTAANDVKFRCEGGAELKSPNGATWGDWQEAFTSCPAGQRVCGVQIKLEGKQGPDDDDTAMNGLSIACCP